MKRILPLLLLLSGCISTEPSQDQLSRNAQRCAAFGYKAGSDKYADCQLQLAEETQQNNDASRRRLHSVFVGMSAAGAAQPAPVVYNPYPPVQRVIIQQPTSTLTQTVNQQPYQRPVY